MALRLAQIPQDFDYLKIILNNLDDDFLEPFSILRRVGKFEFAKRYIPNRYYISPYDYEAIPYRRLLEKTQIEGKTSNILQISYANHANSASEYAQALKNRVAYFTKHSIISLGSIFPFPSTLTFKEQKQYERTWSEFKEAEKAERHRLISDPRKELFYHTENAIR